MRSIKLLSSDEPHAPSRDVRQRAFELIRRWSTSAITTCMIIFWTGTQQPLPNAEWVAIVSSAYYITSMITITNGAEHVPMTPPSPLESPSHNPASTLL
ncbi:unnamed protein product [Rotaria sordida]|uniref:Uncharacterized protein n=1 Tax=Rotaria sordida TaxID=392033 RepID=A0A815A3W9_9BILA|nr:unnamed protein product [Rotaria sordida]CAF1531310.1 unnamed protein product [Rotaria sordida]